MPLIAIAGFARVPRYISHRGNRREDVFHTNDDREVYFSQLGKLTEQNKVQVFTSYLATIFR